MIPILSLFKARPANWKVFLLCLIVVFFLVGCSKSDSEPNRNESNPDADRGSGLVLAEETNPGEPTELVIGYYGNLNSKLMRAFNDAQSDYVLTGIDYSQNGSVPLETAVARLNAELAAGEGPDILYTFRFRLDDVFYGEQGWFEDLYPYIDEDPALSRDDFVPALFRAYEGNGHLYTSLPGFSVETVVVPESLVPEGAQLSLAYLRELVDTCGAETIFGGVSRTAFFESCLSMCLSDLVDLDSGAVQFDSDYFRELLAFCATLPEQSGEEQPKLRLCYINSFMELQYFESVYGEKAVFLGFPSMTGSISSFGNVTDTYAICSNSSNKAGAWQFVRQFFSREYQETGSAAIDAFPSNLFALEAMRETSEKTLYEERDGTLVEKTNRGFQDGFLYHAATKEQTQQVMDLIESATGSFRWNQAISEIALEEAAAYFSGACSLDEAVARIQSRVSIYVAERR